MHSNILKKSTLVFTFFISLFLTACTKEEPHHNHDNEEYDNVSIAFVALDAQGVATSDTTFVSLDAHGNASPNLTTVAANKSYKMLITLSAAGVSVNEEIIADADDHQFFFFASPESAVSDYEYLDSKIGLEGKITFAAAQAFDLQILLRHGLDKNHSGAASFNSSTYQSAGGSNDLNMLIHLKSE
jgi:hypothetical protein